MRQVAVIGPGAIGGTVAAWLIHRGGLDVTVCARTAFDELLVVTPDATIHARPPVLTDPAEAATVDWVLIATKAYDAAETAAWLERLVGPDTRVAVLQNGVEHVARFDRWLPHNRILPTVVIIPAERSAPGYVRQRRNGSIIVPSGENGRDFAALFDGTPISVSISDDFLTDTWSKLAFNAAGAVSALTLQPAGVAAREPVARVMRTIVRECIEVGRAEGARLGDDLPDTVIDRFRSGPPDAITSILADRLAGRTMEIDARNGVIVRLGLKYGIPTPVNEMMIALLEAAGA